jgi:hypothetical protein
MTTTRRRFPKPESSGSFTSITCFVMVSSDYQVTAKIGRRTPIENNGSIENYYIKRHASDEINGQ